MNASFKAVFAVMLMVLTVFSAVSLVSEDSDADGLSTITLQGNGGKTSDGKSSVSYSVISGQGYTLSSSTFTRSGYILAGWAESSGASEPKYYPGQSVTVSSNKTLYAFWEDLTYNSAPRFAGKANSDFMEEAKIISATKGTKVTLPISTDDSVFIFMKETIGRSTYKYTLTVTYQGQPVSSETKTRNTTISADWLSANITRNGDLTLEGSPSREGVYSIEFAYQTSSYGTSYGDLEDLKLRWYVTVPVSADKGETLTFDMDGGSGSVNSVTQPVGSATILPDYTDSSGNEIKKIGWNLVGWEIPDGRGSRSVYALGSLYTIAFDATVTAKWVREPNVLIYSLDGGSLSNVDAYTIYDGMSVTLKDKGVSKEGYTFLGWRPTQDHDVAYAPGLVYEPSSSGPIKMEAYFVPNGSQTYTVTFDANGGQGLVYEQKVESGMYVVLPTTMNMAREGYKFVGWSETADGNPIGTIHYRVEKNTTLYAIWEEDGSTDPEDPQPVVRTYNVTFSTNQGTGNYPVQKVQSEGYAKKPADPTREGHVFLGWRALGKTDMWDFNSDKVTSNTLLQAQWEEHFTTVTDGLKVKVVISEKYFDMRFDVWMGDAVSDTVGPSIGVYEYTFEYTTWGYITVRSYDANGQYESKLTFSVQGEHYNPPAEYIVTFDPANGQDAFQQIVKVGGTAEVPVDPVWKEHVFTGWYYYGSKWEFSTVVTEEMTLTAGWDDIVPDPPERISPKAQFTIATSADGWFMDGSDSVNAVSYAWYLDGEPAGSSRTLDIDIEAVTYGTHSVKLTVTSSTGHTDSKIQTITKQAPAPQPEPEPGKGDEGDKEKKSWFEENKLIVAAVIAVLVIIVMVVRFWI